MNIYLFPVDEEIGIDPHHIIKINVEREEEILDQFLIQEKKEFAQDQSQVPRRKVKKSNQSRCNINCILKVLLF